MFGKISLIYDLEYVNTMLFSLVISHLGSETPKRPTDVGRSCCWSCLCQGRGSCRYCFTGRDRGDLSVGPKRLQPTFTPLLQLAWPGNSKLAKVGPNGWHRIGRCCRFYMTIWVLAISQERGNVSEGLKAALSADAGGAMFHSLWTFWIGLFVDEELAKYIGISQCNILRKPAGRLGKVVFANEVSIGGVGGGAWRGGRKNHRRLVIRVSFLQFLEGHVPLGNFVTVGSDFPGFDSPQVP